MFCSNCGKPTKTADQFCSACGTRLASAMEERTLDAFGPMGTGVCFKRPSFFTVIQKNDTRIVVTDKRICGESTFKPGSLRFNVPYSEVVTLDVFGYMLWKVLWLQYNHAGKLLEVSIMATPTNAQHITWIHEYLQKALRLTP
jgi:hypothetical protein